MRNLDSRPKFRPGIGAVPGYVTCHEEVDAIDYYQTEIDKLTELNEKIIEKTLKRKKHLGICYVAFETVKDFEYIQAKWPFPTSSLDKERIQHLKIKKWEMEGAKPGQEIIWTNLESSRANRNLKKFVSTIFILALALFWTVPVAFFGNLDNIAKIPGIGVTFTNLFEQYPVYYEYLSGLLPALLTLLLFSFFPRICMFLSSFENHHHTSALNTSAMEKLWIFILFNFFVFYLLFASGIDMVQALLENPKSFREAFENLDWSLYGIFYCNYFISATFFDGALSFLRPIAFVRKYFLRLLAYRGSGVERRLIFHPSNFDYFEVFAKEAVYFGIIITFAPIVPLVSLFALMAYCMSYLTDKTVLVLCYSYDPTLAGKMTFRFFLFLNISLVLSYVFWTFYFASHGPYIIFYVAIPVYLFLWICNVGTFYWIVYLNKIPSRKDAELWSILQDTNHGEPEQEYSWEYITSSRAVSQIDPDDFLLAENI